MNIEKNVPIPHRLNGMGAPTKYNWEKLKVGDSILFKNETHRNIESLRVSLLKSAQLYAINNKLSWKFTTSIIDGSVRIWRIK